MVRYDPYDPLIEPIVEDINRQYGGYGAQMDDATLQREIAARIDPVTRQQYWNKRGW